MKCYFKISSDILWEALIESLIKFLNEKDLCSVDLSQNNFSFYTE